MAWLEYEEEYCCAFKQLLVEDGLRRGSVSDWGDIWCFSFSLSVQNRRKARAGYAFEIHLEHIFQTWRLEFDRGANTEGKSKPDFLFPGRTQYHDTNFAASGLSILGAKASCKDRWRQVLGEADRIDTKHLITLEPSISVNQTDEMQSRAVQLVLPVQVHVSYTEAQRGWIWTVERFIEHVQEQQS